MKGDFTRWTFNPKNQFTRVLAQQGRVQLDADTNEQAAILLHSLRTLAEDLIGPGGAPPDPDGTPGRGFRLVAGDKYALLPGRYYVGGIPVENAENRVEAAAGSPLPILKDIGTYLLYLDVWERLVTYVQDDGIREVALGGVDTAARARPVWRVRSRQLDKPTSCVRVHHDWPATLGEIRPANRGLLQAQARRNDSEDDPCIVSPAARYSGENQLYRVEIHQGGTAADGATFKWSRENGSVVFPVADRKSLTLEHLGRDGRFDLEKGDWVEALDDDVELLDEPRALLQVTAVDADRSRVTLSGTAALDGRHPFLRRWDQRERKKDDLKQGAVPIQEGPSFELEDGINIRFVPAANGPAHRYRSGDYWLIPARTATGDVEWPQEPGKPGETSEPQSLPPHGVEHRYAPLGIVTIEKEGGPRAVQDCRATFGAWARVIDTGAADWDFVDPAAGRRPAAVVRPVPASWSQALLPAAWISSSPGAEEGPGPFTFELTFPLSSRQALLSFKLLADNSAQVRLNGRDLVTHKRPKNEGFKGEPAFYETDDPAFFVSGTNTLTVVVTNTGTGTSPMGFVLAGRVDTGQGCCC